MGGARRGMCKAGRSKGNRLPIAKGGEPLEVSFCSTNLEMPWDEDLNHETFCSGGENEGRREKTNELRSNREEKTSKGINGMDHCRDKSVNESGGKRKKETGGTPTSKVETAILVCSERIDNL